MFQDSIFLFVAVLLELIVYQNKCLILLHVGTKLLLFRKVLLVLE